MSRAPIHRSFPFLPPSLPPRSAFGRPIYTGLLSLSLLLAINYSLSTAYLLPLLRSRVSWRQTCGWIWQSFLLLNAAPLLACEYWQFHTRVGGGREGGREGGRKVRTWRSLLTHL